MIECFEGAIGSGKSMFAVNRIIEELQTTDHFITVNDALGLNIKAMSAALVQKFGEDFNLHERIRILNMEETVQFWRHPAKDFNLTGNVEVPVAVGTEKELIPDYAPIHPGKGFTGALVVIDETPAYFDAEDWGEVGREMKHFMRHSRKLGVDVIFIAQDRSQIAKPLRVFFQQTTVCRNLMYESLSVFRLPKRIYWRLYFKTPDHCSRPMKQGVTSIDAKFLGSMYDTSAGVGMTGGRKADTQRRAKGLPIYFLLAVIALGAVGLVCFPHILGWAIGHLEPKPKVYASSPQSLRAANAPGGLRSFPFSYVTNNPAVEVTPAAASGTPVSTDVFMDGYAHLPQGWMVALSDGRWVHSWDVQFQRLSEDGVLYGGVYYKRSLARRTERMATTTPDFGCAVESNHQAISSVVVPVAPVDSQSAEIPAVSSRRRYRFHWSDGAVTEHKPADNQGGE